MFYFFFSDRCLHRRLGKEVAFSISIRFFFVGDEGYGVELDRSEHKCHKAHFIQHIFFHVVYICRESLEDLYCMKSFVGISDIPTGLGFLT